MAFNLHDHDDENDSITPPSRRHEDAKCLSDKIALWLRWQKPGLEIETGKSFRTQLREVISIMISHNNALLVHMLWALNVMEEKIEDNLGTPYTKIYMWKRYVVDCLNENGLLCSGGTSTPT
jgi:hypothetical protein